MGGRGTAPSAQAPASGLPRVIDPNQIGKRQQSLFYKGEVVEIIINNQLSSLGFPSQESLVGVEEVGRCFIPAAILPAAIDTHRGFPLSSYSLQIHPLSKEISFPPATFYFEKLDFFSQKSCK